MFMTGVLCTVCGAQVYLLNMMGRKSSTSFVFFGHHDHKIAEIFLCSSLKGMWWRMSLQTMWEGNTSYIMIIYPIDVLPLVN